MMAASALSDHMSIEAMAVGMSGRGGIPENPIRYTRPVGPAGGSGDDSVEQAIPPKAVITATADRTSNRT